LASLMPRKGYIAMAEFLNDYKCLDCRHCYKKNSAFRLLNEEELGHLDNHRIEVWFKEGEVVFKQGTPLTHLVILNEGLGKIYVEGPNGRDLILNFAKPFEFIGGPGMHVDMRHHSSLMVLEKSGACFLEMAAFKKVMKGNPEFHEAFVADCSQRFLHVLNHLVVLTQKNMEGRIAEALLYLKNQVFGQSQIRLISRQDLADLTAMTKESAMRVLKDFKSEGLVEENANEITVLDEKALVRIAQLS
jgi:CRP/FNR family transcriptional regulator, polysaccharide utilization system transcription regulator